MNAGWLDGFIEQEEWLYSLASQLTVDDASARDLVQQTWATTLRNPPRDSSKPRAWLGTVLRRHAITSFRRSAPELGDLDLLQAAGPGPAEVAQEEDAKDQLRAAVAELDEHLRAVVLLICSGTFTHAAIAGQLGITERTVRHRLETAHAQLRRSLGSEDQGDGRPASWRVALAPLLSRDTQVPAAAVPTTATGVLLFVGMFAVVGLAAVLGIRMGTGPGHLADDKVAVERLAQEHPAGEDVAPVSLAQRSLPAMRETVSTDANDKLSPLATTVPGDAMPSDPRAVEPVRFWVRGRILIDGKPPGDYQAVLLRHGWMATQPPIPEQMSPLAEDGTFSVAARETGFWALLIRPQARTTGSHAYRIFFDLAPGNEEQVADLDIKTGSAIVHIDGHEDEYVYLWSPSNSWEYLCNAIVKDGTVTGSRVPVGELSVRLRPDKSVVEHDQFQPVGSGWIEAGETTVIQVGVVH